MRSAERDEMSLPVAEAEELDPSMLSKVMLQNVYVDVDVCGGTGRA